MNTKSKLALAAIGLFVLAPLIAGASSLASIATISYLGQIGLPRGLRNNNPGNIRLSSTAWQGKIPNSKNTDGAFEQFQFYVYGIRAMIKNLLSYYGAGLDTIEKIVYKWAPPSDGNNTEAYVNFIAAKTGFSRAQTLNLSARATMSPLVRAMAQMENYGGAQNAPAAVTEAQFNYAWSLLYGIGNIYPEVPQLFECKDGTYSTAAGRRGCSRHGGKVSPSPLTFSSASQGSTRLQIADVPLSRIQTNTTLFQGREKSFSARSVENIVSAVLEGSFVWENLDPVTLWKSPQGELFLLSGHSRFKAFETLAEMGATADGKDFNSIPAKIITTDLPTAQRLALESNTLSTKETDIERAAYYRRLLQDGLDGKKILAQIKKNEGKNWANIYANTFLNPAGRAWATLKQFAEGEDTSATLAKSLCRWIGNARRLFPLLTNEHEAEIFAWLFDHKGYGNGAGQVSSEREFLEKMERIVQKNTTFGTFEDSKPLNILQTQQKSPTEQAYEAQISALTQEVQDLDKTLKTKIKTLTDQGATPADLQRIVSPIEAALRTKRSQLARLLQKRSEIIDYSKREAALFGHRRRRRSYSYV